MTWSYSGDPGASLKDAVRFILQDTDPNQPLMEDEEIEYVLTYKVNPVSAAAELAEILAGRFARAVNTSLGDYEVSLSDLSEKYRLLAKDLRRKITLTSAVPYAGGISRSDKSRQKMDSDRLKPFFERKQFDYRRGSR